jgi:hypothetical protein
VLVPVAGAEPNCDSVVVGVGVGDGDRD